MTETLDDVVYPEEIDFFVQSLREFSLEQIGSRQWMECHEFVIKLSQQATLEATLHREEVVKESLILHSKLKVLVHEAYAVFVWKTKVLPILLEMEKNPPAMFLIYTVLFHEGAVISLLEIALFHQHGCEALEESAVDLVDYCALGISQLIGLVSMGYHEKYTKVDVDESILSELERIKRDLIYKIGLRCISILNYMVDKLDVMSLSVGKRMVTVHDVPCLLSEVLHFKPWLRKTDKGHQKYIDEHWKNVVGDDFLKVTKTEAQTWFCFRQILFNENVMKNYEITEFRQRELAKCQGLLYDLILDQLPPLAELKRFLCTLQVSSPNQTKLKNMQNFLLEEVPQIKEKIIKDVEQYGGFIQVAEDQAEIFLTSKKEDIFAMAKRLNEAYNTDLIAKIESTLEVKENQATNDDGSIKKCVSCKKDAEKRCARCLSVYYCSRECQTDDWPTHKQYCNTSSANKESK